ncbi:CRISPR-associated helicase Cas3' [Paenibacillus brevis]|uniref:CRISPR-associated helicase Cas3 n=1 Tax=Paenibacillus brevis TaxID=2841508 RepID=A0ABS6FUZ5_9BACL|nr:CRISPR-associated helicase Cas3' [Paenibacillus brevis]MBU5673277.1 CRISPR-associated helicase Cas3' [Paenibacillus brevis]
MLFYAHSTNRKDKSDWQLLLTHLKQVAEEAGEFAKKFKAWEWGWVAGLLHDLGKYSLQFQKRLDGSSIPVEHALAGALELLKRNTDDKTGPQARLLAYIIAGHHAGLADYQSDKDSALVHRLEREPAPYDAAFAEITIPDVPMKFPLVSGLHTGLQISLFVRMIFSCLVDADSLNTEGFCDPVRSKLRGKLFEHDLFWAKFQHHRELKFANVDRTTEINLLREELYQECLSQATEIRGIFKLSLPTGAGKTLISFGFGLEHAKRAKFERLIYVIPFVSIIEQNSGEFRDILGSEYVLEHHSNYQHEKAREKLTEKDIDALKLAEENWDMPVVVTTNVQFFESLFSSKRSRARKLHNIANSMIILDEAQLMMGGFFKPCLYVLDELVRNYGCSVMICTATQPPISSILDKTAIKEIVADPTKRYKQFERVNLNFIGKCSWKDIATRIVEGEPQSLCIVNTRGNALNLYSSLKKSYKPDELYHLSARMTPKHRSYILSIVRQRLLDHLPCILISTQLIEAGVDVDFPVVFREIAGLDSIAQAAGRCNRNGLREKGGLKVHGDVFVFEPEQEYRKNDWLYNDISAAKAQLLRCKVHNLNPLSQEVIDAYYQHLYFYKSQGDTADSEAHDKEGILSLLNKEWRGFSFPFAEVSQKFKLIDDKMRPIVIPYIVEDDLESQKQWNELLNKLQNSPLVGRELYRKLQPYTVQVYPHEFNALLDGGELDEVRTDIFILRRPIQWYDKSSGLVPYSRDIALQEILNI